MQKIHTKSRKPGKTKGEIHSMKRPYRTLLTILAIAAIDVLFFYGLLWILRAICSAVALIVGLIAWGWFLY